MELRVLRFLRGVMVKGIGGDRDVWQAAANAGSGACRAPLPVRYHYPGLCNCRIAGRASRTFFHIILLILILNCNYLVWFQRRGGNGVSPPFPLSGGEPSDALSYLENRKAEVNWLTT